MPTASLLLLALALTVIAGSAVTAWLWLVQRPRAERTEGLKLLSAMRWREFSRLVVDGLRDRGFEPEAAEEAAKLDPDVLRLKRDGHGWLLVCKQGNNQRIASTVVGDMADAMRFHGAQGGVIATLGTIDPQARDLARGRIELIDGAALWPLVRPQLGTSVQEALAAASCQATRRQSIIAWAGPLALGLLAATMMPRMGGNVGSSEASPAVADRTGPTTAAAAAAAMPGLAPPPMSEEEQRTEVVRLVSMLPGIERAMWSTRSTLLVTLIDESADPVNGICAVVEKYDALRTSRLHLQPPAGARRPARFRQCKTF